MFHSLLDREVDILSFCGVCLLFCPNSNVEIKVVKIESVIKLVKAGVQGLKVYPVIIK